MNGVQAAARAASPELELRGVGARVGERWILRGIGLRVAAGETVAVVGPSGAGKSTLARLALGLIPVAEGTVRVAGQDWAALTESQQWRLRPRLGYVQQDPQRALNPMMTVAEIVCEGLEVQARGRELPRPGWGSRRRAWRHERAGEWLERVGVGEDKAGCYPHQLSGGQRQRVAIARALITSPRLLVADEPVAALDASTGAEVMETLAQLRQSLKLGVLLVTHQLPQVVACAQRLVVLAPGDGGGHIVEEGPTAKVLAAPQSAMTRALIAAVPPWPPHTALAI